MTYLKFPFGKHKGELIEDLPTTYIVHALETFDLPIELISRLKIEIIKRLDLIGIALIINDHQKQQNNLKTNLDIWDTIPNE